MSDRYFAYMYETIYSGADPRDRARHLCEEIRLYDKEILKGGVAIYRYPERGYLQYDLRCVTNDWYIGSDPAFEVARETAACLLDRQIDSYYFSGKESASRDFCYDCVAKSSDGEEIRVLAFDGRVNFLLIKTTSDRRGYFTDLLNGCRGLFPDAKRLLTRPTLAARESISRPDVSDDMER